MEDEAASTCDFQPTYRGIIASAEDVFTLVEACLSGYISCENASRTKRWVDGVSWGPPTRVANGCVWYRQVNVTQYGQKLIAKSQKIAVESKHSPASIEARPAVLESWADIHEKNNDLFPTDSNTKPDYTENGLVKKIISFTVGSMTLRLISHYSTADAPERGKLQRPSKDPELIDLRIRQELLDQYCKIPFSKHGRHDKDWYRLKSNDGMPAPSSYDPMDEDWYSLKSNDGMPLGRCWDACTWPVQSYGRHWRACT
ncbi:hypothetical protein V500_07286 [Pseudogymnoascus sp. VKM F-4518 (FW-2643)]|nr:hypothetical protein V500_07286 [Pseudogymnoascus sp. VKM F-4518 (FW-2643)]